MEGKIVENNKDDWLGDKMKKGEKGGTCSTCGVQGFGEKI
jgi:hypothetical protein